MKATHHYVDGPGDVSAHKIRWYAKVGDGEYIPRTASMRVGHFGWDAKCSCGWESHTGGGIHAWVERLVDDHKLDVKLGLTP